MEDIPMHKFVFIGKLRWRYRWQHIGFALKVLWNAIHGYNLTVECYECPTNE